MANPKAKVTKLDAGGFDVEFDGVGRVILGADEASSQKEAEKVARERLSQAGRTLDEQGDQPAPNTEVTVDDEGQQAADEAAAANRTSGTDETADRTDEVTGDTSDARKSA